MGSLRADVNGLVDMWRKVLCTEATLRAVKLTEFKPSSLSYNLLADFSFISALRVISSKPKEARNCLNLAVDNYERAVLHAPNCIETAAAHGAALVALGRLDEAQAVFDRGLSIENPDHPWLHHGIIQISGGAKSDYVADARARITAQSSMLQEEKHCEKIRKMIRRMGRSSDTPPQVLAAVKQLSSDKPFSVRAKILQYELIEITLRQGCNPSVKLDLIHAALEAMQDASSQYCNSLPIAYYHAKQLNTLGWLAAAKDECHRALNIMYPDEPNLHDIPLGFTRGHLHAERVMVWKEKLKQLPERVVGTAKVAVQEMSTDEQGRFVWLKVSDLIDHVGQDTEASAIVKEAVDNYKRGSSWLFWFCPIAEGSSCCEFRTRKSSDILRHITAHIDLDHRLCRDLQCELPHRAVLQLQTDDTDIVLTHDQDGFPIICFASIHKLMESFVTDDKFSFKEFISQKSVSAMIKFEEFVDLVETNSSFDAIKMSWLDFLEASYATYLQYILPLIVSVKWEELKQMFESIDEMNKWNYEFQMDLSQVVNKEDKNKVGKPFQEEQHCNPSDEGILLDNEQTKVAAPRIRQSILYGHSFNGKFRHLFDKPDKPLKEVRNHPSFTYRDKIMAEDAAYNPYADIEHHKAYRAALEKLKKGHALCTFCFFEKKSTRSFSFIFFHMVTEHSSVGFECDICGVRFVTGSALADHNEFCHEQQAGAGHVAVGGSVRSISFSPPWSHSTL